MNVVGVRPWFPGILARWDWLTAPVRAERLAALRIGVGAVLLIDILGTYLPFVADYYGVGSLAGSGVFAARFEVPHWHWSVLQWLPEDWGPIVALAGWGLAAVALLAGYYPRVAAGVAWALSLSFYNSNYYLHNSGDRLRHTLLFILMLAPCGAAWTVSLRALRNASALPSPRSGRGETTDIFVYPWPLRLLFVQMTIIYFCNGVYKLLGPEWRDGSVLNFIMTDAGWSRCGMTLPPWLALGAAWVVMIWELGFPLWILAPTSRMIALGIGVLFHVGTGLHLELGMFPLYALCFYFPLVPWEQWPARWRPAHSRTSAARSTLSLGIR